MKITVNKAKIKKLASWGEKSQAIGAKNLYFCAGNVWAARGGTLISTPYKIEEGEEMKMPFSVEIEKIKKVIDKAPEVKKGEIQIDFYSIEGTTLHNKGIGYLERMTNAETVAEIDRMFYALIAPKSRSESVNIMVTDKQVKAELIDHYKFVGGVEIEQKNDLAAPLLFYLSDDFIFPLSKKQSEKYSIVRESDYKYKEDGGYYLKYESLSGTTYQALYVKGEKAKFFSDEIKAAYKSEIEQMKEQSEPTTEPEPTTIEPEPDKEKEQMQEQEKKEIETTTEQEGGAPAMESTSEPTTEQPESTGWTGRANYQERKEARAEYREQKAAELHRQADKLRESIPTDYAYWTQPAHTYSAAGRAFERQRERERGKYDKIYKMERRAEYLENHTESTAISSDDPEALDKLAAKIEELTQEQERMKEANKQARKEGRAAPYPSYHLQNNNQNINRLKKRVEELKRRQDTSWKDYIFDGGTVEADVEDNRYKIFYDEKPEQNIIDFLKSHGWRWSKFNKCWQRLLNRETARCIESSGKWGYIDYLPGLHEMGTESETEEPTQEPEQATDTETAAMQEGAESVEPVEESQPEGAPVEITEEKEPEQIEQEPTEAGVLPMTDQLKLWGLPLDWERVQVIKHNAQESGLALMVYNTEGDGALFAMLPGFWAIVKERSKFDENSERFIRDNYDGVICYFDKDPEQAEMQEEPKAANPPIYTESVKWMEDAKTVSIPAPVVACKVDAPVQIPEPKPTDEEPDPEQIDKTKPTGAELRYSLSLLAMPYPIDTLIEKFLKKTNKPVRYSIVEKLLMTIDRGSVPKPGESKREYIKAYYQTH